jgi:hypothetical protein
MIEADSKGPPTDPKYRAALAKNHRLARTLGLDAVMTKHRRPPTFAPTVTL